MIFFIKNDFKDVVLSMIIDFQKYKNYLYISVDYQAVLFGNYCIALNVSSLFLELVTTL